VGTILGSHLNANESFVIIFTSKLITWFIDGVTLKMKSKSIAYLLNGNEHIYWIWDLEDKVHSIWNLWTSGLQECKNNDFFKIRRAGNNFQSGTENQNFLEAAAPDRIFLPGKVRGGNLTSSTRACISMRNLNFTSVSGSLQSLLLV